MFCHSPGEFSQESQKKAEIVKTAGPRKTVIRSHVTLGCITWCHSGLCRFYKNWLAWARFNSVHCTCGTVSLGPDWLVLKIIQWEKVTWYMRGTNKSPLEDSLLLRKKNFQVKLQFLTSPQMLPTKIVPIITFIIDLKLVIKMPWSGCKIAVHINKQYDNVIVGLINLKSLNLAACCLCSGFIYL